jgi:mannosyltransferase OCH1-like enzyme
MKKETAKEIAKRILNQKRNKKPCVSKYISEMARKYLDNAVIEIKEGSLWIKKDDNFVKIYCYNHGASHIIYYKNDPTNSFYDGLMLKEKLLEKYIQYIETTEENGTQIS